jgi:hypothetical protein
MKSYKTQVAEALAQRKLPGAVGFDFRVISADSSIILLRPLTQEARNWIHDRVAGERTYFGGNLAVEPRYIIELVTGFIADGLTLAPLHV